MHFSVKLFSTSWVQTIKQCKAKIQTFVTFSIIAKQLTSTSDSKPGYFVMSTTVKLANFPSKAQVIIENDHCRVKTKCIS